MGCTDLVAMLSSPASPILYISLCCMRRELPSVLGIAQSRGSPCRSSCQRHCTLALLPGKLFGTSTLGPPCGATVRWDMHRSVYPKSYYPTQCSRCLLLALHDRVRTRFFRQPFSRQDVDGGAPLFINERGGYWALPPLSLGLLAAHLFGCQATPSMTNFVVTLVHFLCGLRWELPSVLGTAQSRGSPNRSWCQRHCTLALLLVNGSVLLHLAHLQCHNLVRHALKRTPNPNTPLGNC